jgi:hypothetical protein
MLHGRGVRPSALDVVVVAPRKRRDARYELLVVATVDQTLIRGLGPHGNSSSEGCLALLTGSSPSNHRPRVPSGRSRCPDLPTDYLRAHPAVAARLTAQMNPTSSRAIAVTTT